MSDGNKKRKQQRKWTLNFGIWNIRGIINKQQEIISEFIDRKIDIAVLSETKKKGNGIENIKEYIHIYTGVDKNERAQAGISILIHKRLQKYIKSWESFSERIIKLTLQIRGRIITVLGVYALNNDAPVQKKDSFEESLRNIINQIPNKEEIIIAGDLNGRVGRHSNSSVVGMHGEKSLNDNGERLLNICEQFELRITNTFFAHKDIHKYTWYQHTRGLKSIIDYLIVRQHSGIKVQDIRVKRGADCGSDHCLLVAKIYIPFATSHQNQTCNIQKEGANIIRYNLDSLEQYSTRYLYSNRLEQKLVQTTRTTEEEYEHIKRCITEAAQEALGIENVNKKTYWWDDEIERQIKEKKELYKKFLQKNDTNTKEQYERANRKVKQDVLKKKNTAWLKKCEYIDQQLGGSKSSEAWKTIKSIRTTAKQRTHISNISNQEWVRYFKDLLEERRPKFRQEEKDYITGDEVELQIAQVEEAIKTTKLKKSSGPGGIYPELVRYGPPKLTAMLKNLYERCLNGEDIPTEWGTSHIIPIHKKGAKDDPKNFRGIAVIPTIARIYSRILRNLIEEEIVNKQPEEQAGFRAGRSTTDNIFTLKIACEKRVQRNRETHIAMIDLEKAYDSVPLSELWGSLTQLKISDTLINATRKYYTKNSAKIKVGSTLTESFYTTKGLRQGCCLSPTLFKIYLDKALHGWTNKCKNMGLKVGEDMLYSLYFADDQVVIAEDEDDLSYMVRKLQEAYHQAGLTINMNKSEYLVIGNSECKNLPLETETIQGVEKCKYLGIILNKNGSSSDEIKERITKGRKIIGALNSLIWEKDIRRETKKRIYKSIVESVMVYGAEVWDVSETNRRKLLATEMDYLRRSCRRSRLEMVRNTEIREMMDKKHNITDEIERRQLVWFGHTKRMDENRWPRKVLEWIPPERRKRGRPRRSWRDGIEEAMKFRNLAENTCHDRKNWKLGTEKRRQL